MQQISVSGATSSEEETTVASIIGTTATKDLATPHKEDSGERHSRGTLSPEPQSSETSRTPLTLSPELQLSEISRTHKACSKNPEGQQVRQFTWGETTGMTMVVPVSLGGSKSSAVVDTAAQVSLIRQSVWDELSIHHDAMPEIVQLANAQKDSGMEGKLFNHVGFMLGGRKYYLDIVVADISDPMILGLDFLKTNQCKINLEDDSLELNGNEKIFAVMKDEKSDKRYHVSRVLMAKKATVPPHSIKVVSVKLQNPAGVVYAVEPSQRPSLFIPSVVVKGEEDMTLCLLNMSGHNMKFRRNAELGRATEVDAMLLKQDADDEDRGMQADLYICGKKPQEEQMKVCRIKKIVRGIPEVELEDGTKEAGDMEVWDPGLEIRTCSVSTEMLECVVNPQDKPPDRMDVMGPRFRGRKHSESTETLECVVNPQDKPPDGMDVIDPGCGVRKRS